MSTHPGMHQQQGRRRHVTPQDPVGAAEDRRDGGELLPHEQVELAAYFIAEQRGFEPGHEMEDWIAAEREVARAGAGSSPSAG